MYFQRAQFPKEISLLNIGETGFLMLKPREGGAYTTNHVLHLCSCLSGEGKHGGKYLSCT